MVQLRDSCSVAIPGSLRWAVFGRCLRVQEQLAAPESWHMVSTLHGLLQERQSEGLTGVHQKDCTGGATLKPQTTAHGGCPAEEPLGEIHCVEG